jgi:hypothetical protein
VFNNVHLQALGSGETISAAFKIVVLLKIFICHATADV